jgi:hypothetical protein
MIPVKKIFAMLGLAALLVAWNLAYSLWAIHSASKRLTECHVLVMALQQENGQLKIDLAKAQAQIPSVKILDQNCTPDELTCTAIIAKTVSAETYSRMKKLQASVDRLKTKTYLVNLERPSNSPDVSRIIKLPGTLGMVMNLIQQISPKDDFSPPVSAGQVWILPTQMEPMYSGDASRAWVIHVDSQSGRAVDQPHHPYPAQAQQ